MNGKLLPADTYIVVNKTILSLEDKKKITMLYQPIIGHTAVSLYLTLVDDLEKRDFMSGELTHHHLVSIMQLKINDIVIAREKLEAIGLLKTYVKEGNVNNYVYVLYSPLSANDFFNHPILSVVLFNNLGKKEYEKLIDYFKIPRINLKDYTDITANFSQIFTPVSGNVFTENDNIVKKNIGSIKMDEKVDFDLLISSIPKELISDKCFNEETRNLINSLAFTYNIDNLNMQGLVRNNLNEKGLIDKVSLTNDARNFYEFDNAGKLPTLIYSKQPTYLKSPKGDTSNRAKMIYTFENVTPYDYLRSKYKTGEPTLRELQIIEDLMVKQKMKPGVVNVLISYVLQVNSNKFTRSYVETVASQWCRMNIETVEEAMEVAEKEHKKIKKLTEKTNTTKKSSTATEDLPPWFEKNIEKKEMSKEEKEELNNLLKEF
ncbi:MAG: DnaD domain protein [Bacilli bacterium]|nr:DnaD domain protein [Bacilli bacterium]